jgi:hypothetical protein
VVYGALDEQRHTDLANIPLKVYPDQGDPKLA